jgi:DNA-binding SARP family transcriptional activator
MRFQILGPFEAVQGDRRANFTRQQARILAALVLADGALTADDLTMAASGDAPAPGYNTMEQAVRRLRIKLTEEGAQASVPIRDQHEPYRLDLNGDTTDVAAFRFLLANAHKFVRSGAATSAASTFEKAVRLWRGQPLAAQTLPKSLAALRKRLEEEYLQAVVHWSDAAYITGGLSGLVVPLAELCTRQPDSEPLSYRYALALHAGGRTSEALAELRRLKSLLIADGLDVPDQTGRLYLQLLNQVGPLSLDARPNPSSPPKFMTGRHEQATLIAGKLLAGGTDPAIVVLSGGPGVGKSALAAVVAQQIQHARPLQLEIKLQRDDSATDLLARLLGLAGLALPMPSGLEERAALLHRFLEGKDAFLLLDNVRDEEQIAAAVASGWSAVLITSQKQLSGLYNADVVPVKPLTDDAARLLLTRLSGEG